PPELNTGFCCVVPACPFRQPYMIFLFVGSSGLTETSFPRDIAIPQLPRSSTCVILLPMKASRTTVFTYAGTLPRQFTPMSGAHQALDRVRGSAVRRIEQSNDMDALPLIGQPGRYAAC